MLPLLSMPLSSWKCTSHFCLRIRSYIYWCRSFVGYDWTSCYVTTVLFLGINIAVVNWVIGSNLKCFWFLHLAIVLILLGLFFCRRRKKKSFWFFWLSLSWWIQSYCLRSQCQGSHWLQWSMQYKASKKCFAICVGTDCRRKEAGKKMFSFFFSGGWSAKTVCSLACTLLSCFC